jgi:hypothetical protein
MKKISLVLAALWLAPLITLSAAPLAAVFPEKHWEKLDSPAQHGWSAAKLDEAHQFAKIAGSAALLVVERSWMTGGRRRSG